MVCQGDAADFQIAVEAVLIIQSGWEEYGLGTRLESPVTVLYCDSEYSSMSGDTPIEICHMLSATYKYGLD